MTTLRDKLTALEACDATIREEMHRLPPTGQQWHDRAREHDHNVKMIGWLKQAIAEEASEAKVQRVVTTTGQVILY